jgi:hypothetical protein
LGVRHFVLDPAQSFFQVKIGGGLTIPLGSFQGQSNGQNERAFLDLEAGQPNEEGQTNVNIVAASDFIFVDARMLAGFVICIKPIVPVADAGVLACDGGVDISFSLNQDHRLGLVGVDGFTAEQCAAMNGQIESPYSACSAGMVGLACEADPDCDAVAGASDGTCAHNPGVCTAGRVGTACLDHPDCATATNAGVCGMPHRGVCNGPLTPTLGSGDTGPGALLIVPNPDPEVQLNGFPIELGFESALPCGDEAPGNRIAFALTSGLSQSMVLNANNELGRTLSFEAEGENFDCQNWQASNRGRLVLSAPALDQALVGDVATIFNFASR